MKYLLLSLTLLASTLHATEPARYTTEEVCENPAGCKFVEDKCIGCVTKETHGPAPIINNNTTNNYNKTEIHNHNYTKETVIKETVKEVPVTTELVVKHEYVTVTEPVERLRPYISVNDNDSIKSLPDGAVFYLVDSANINPGDIGSLQVLVGGGILKQDLDSILRNASVKGIALKGSKEDNTGFKDYDELADILEELEIAD